MEVMVMIVRAGVGNGCVIVRGSSDHNYFLLLS